MSEALLVYEDDQIQLVAATTYASGEVLRLSDGRVGIVAGLKAIASGDAYCVYTEGVFALAAATGVTFLIGEAVYWDASANTAINVANVGVGDFFAGYATKAKVSGELVVETDINAVNKPKQQKTVATATTLDASDMDETLFVDTQAGALTITLPPVAGVLGRRLTFIRAGTGTNAITVDGDASETVDGSATHTAMDAARDTITIEAAAAGWFIISARIA